MLLKIEVQHPYLRTFQRGALRSNHQLTLPMSPQPEKCPQKKKKKYRKEKKKAGLVDKKGCNRAGEGRQMGKMSQRPPALLLLPLKNKFSQNFHGNCC